MPAIHQSQNDHGSISSMRHNMNSLTIFFGSIYSNNIGFTVNPFHLLLVSETSQGGNNSSGSKKDFIPVNIENIPCVIKGLQLYTIMKRPILQSQGKTFSPTNYYTLCFSLLSYCNNQLRNKIDLKKYHSRLKRMWRTIHRKTII